MFFIICYLSHFIYTALKDSRINCGPQHTVCEDMEIGRMKMSHGKTQTPCLACTGGVRVNPVEIAKYTLTIMKSKLFTMRESVLLSDKASVSGLFGSHLRIVSQP